MKRNYLPAFALLLAAGVAAAAPTPQRIRGTISSTTDGALVIHTAAGSDQQITLDGDTKYVRVTRSDLSKVEPGTFIGTATKDVGPTLVALEVVVFPPAMKGTGEGHYDWDQITDTTATAVSSAKPMTKSKMTNGDIASANSKDGSKQLTVTYKGGQQNITVPPTAPIVALVPGSKADATKDAPVFVVAVSDGGPLVAKFVAVGVDGVVPPM
jgi:hypothetical protein